MFYKHILQIKHVFCFIARVNYFNSSNYYWNPGVTFNNEYIEIRANNFYYFNVAIIKQKKKNK